MDAQEEPTKSDESPARESVPPETLPPLWWERIVQFRWLICIGFIACYYLGKTSISLPTGGENSPLAWRHIQGLLLGLDIAVVATVGVAVYPAVKGDYLARVKSGFNSLRTSPCPDSGLSLKELLDHARWCNVQLNVMITVVLGVTAVTLKSDWVPFEHRPVALAVVVLLFVALFDALLDLEAEWTLTMLAATRLSPEGNLALVIWKTNQFRPGQEDLLARRTRPNSLAIRQVTATAQNIMMFASAIIIGTLAQIGWQLLGLLQWSPGLPN